MPTGPSNNITWTIQEDENVIKFAHGNNYVLKYMHACPTFQTPTLYIDALQSSQKLKLEEAVNNELSAFKKKKLGLLKTERRTRRSSARNVYLQLRRKNLVKLSDLKPVSLRLVIVKHMLLIIPILIHR